MVFGHQGECPTQWNAIESISAKFVNHETFRVRVRRSEADAGQRPGLSTDELAKIKELECEVKELKRSE